MRLDNDVTRNLGIDNRLIAEAQRLGRHRTKREAVTAALVEYIQRRKEVAQTTLLGLRLFLLRTRALICTAALSCSRSISRTAGTPMKIKVVLYPSDEGFAVSAPGLPGCWSQGATREEAMANLAGAVRDYLDEHVHPEEVDEIREIEGDD